MKRIQKNRKSLFSVIPSDIVEDLDLKAGDRLDFSVENGIINAILVAPSAKNELQAHRAPHISVHGDACD